MYDQAIEINPNDAETYFNKGETIIYIFEEIHFALKENLLMQLRCMIRLFCKNQIIQKHIFLKARLLYIYFKEMHCALMENLLKQLECMIMQFS